MTTRPPFADPTVAAVFKAYPQILRAHLMALRTLIHETATELDPASRIVEGLKWGQPAFRRAVRSEGTTIRIDALRDAPDCYGLFVHCQTTLAEDLRALCPESFAFRGIGRW